MWNIKRNIEATGTWEGHKVYDLQSVCLSNTFRWMRNFLVLSLHSGLGDISVVLGCGTASRNNVCPTCDAQNLKKDFKYVPVSTKSRSSRFSRFFQSNQQREEEEEGVSSYWMTLRERQDNVN